MSSAVNGANTLYRRFSNGMGLGRSHSQTDTSATTPNGSKSSGASGDRDKEGFVRKRRRLISLSRYAKCGQARGWEVEGVDRSVSLEGGGGVGCTYGELRSSGDTADCLCAREPGLELIGV